MKTLPQIKGNWGNLNAIIGDGTRQRIFVAALRLKMFDYVKGSTGAQIASESGNHMRNTELLLNALAGMGLVKKKNGHYWNTDQTRDYLVSTGPSYLGAYLLHMNDFNEKFPYSVEDLVRQGPPLLKVKDMGDENMWAESARLAAAYQYGGEAQRIASMIACLPEFPYMKRMLDLGGGSGFYTMAIVSAHPHMSGVILEQPAVARVASEFVSEYGMDERVSVISGDYMKDEFEGPYDLVFAGSTLNFFKNQFELLFRKVYDALAPGGIFITHQDGIKEERTRPVNHVSEFLLWEMMGDDFAITQGQIADAMLKCSFKTVRSFTVTSNIGEMDIDIGRK